MLICAIFCPSVAVALSRVNCVVCLPLRHTAQAVQQINNKRTSWVWAYTLYWT